MPTIVDPTVVNKEQFFLMNDATRYVLSFEPWAYPNQNYYTALLREPVRLDVETNDSPSIPLQQQTFQFFSANVKSPSLSYNRLLNLRVEQSMVELGAQRYPGERGYPIGSEGSGVGSFSLDRCMTLFKFEVTTLPVESDRVAYTISLFDEFHSPAVEYVMSASPSRQVSPPSGTPVGFRKRSDGVALVDCWTLVPVSDEVVVIEARPPLFVSPGWHQSHP